LLTALASARPPPDELVHFTQQIPHTLVGLVIGVKGASIHAVVRFSALRQHASMRAHAPPLCVRRS
jgi:hypothetical protein